MEAPFRLTPATLDVLEVLLVGRDEMHGFAIAQEAGRPTGSFRPILFRMERAGWVDSRWEAEHPEPGKPRRRFYRLNPTGLAASRPIVLDRRGRLPSARPLVRRSRPVLGFIRRRVAMS